MSNDKDKAMVPAGGGPPVVQHPPTRADMIATEMDPQRAVEQIIEAGKAFDRLRAYALSLTDSKCWDKMQGKPRLNAYGAHLIAKKIGLRVRTFPSIEIDSGKDKEGEYFVFQCTGEVSHPLSPAVVSCQGTCDSRNKFHTTRYKDGKRVQLEAHQVQRTNISQQAHTLCKTKGITEYLGLDRLDWKEVERATKAKEDEAATVDFKDGSGKGKRQKTSGPPPEQKKRPGDEPASGKDRSLVWDAFVEKAKWNKADLPKDAAGVFYGFVEGVLGADRRDKSTWTVQDVDDLLSMIEGGEPPDDGPPVDEDGLPQG